MQISSQETPGLILAAKQLKNERLVRLFESLLEYRVCVSRVVVQGIIVLWTGAWLFGPQPVLVHDAQNVFWIAVGLFFSALGWMLAVRFRWINREWKWLDAAGFTISLTFIGIQTQLAFILLISLNAFLPFIAIAAVARYGRLAMRPVLGAIFVLLVITAPHGYWLTRPAYFVYAVLLTIMLPWMVARMLLGMQEIAFQAISSRDAQGRFISTMSHELRTPLNAVINCAQLIETESMAPSQRELLDAVSINATALQHRVNAVLDVASIDGGRLVLVQKPFNLANVLTTVQAVCGSTASAKGVTLTLELDAQEAPAMMGDEGRIEQVVTNLATNGIKSTEPGGLVEVKIAASRDGEHWSVRVTVVDTGIGIDEDKRERIFQPFTQVSSGSRRSEGGIGLGLYIASSVSNAMGGTLIHRPNPEGGSIFEWRFQAQASEPDSARSIAVRDLLLQHRKTVMPRHALVFEDMETNRLVIANLLQLAGHSVEFQEDGYHAAERIRRAGADVVFLDLHMPGRSGWDVLEELGSNIGDFPPVVVLTADTRPAVVAAAIAAGAHGFLAKPIDAHELLDVIQMQSLQRSPA